MRIIGRGSPVCSYSTDFPNQIRPLLIPDCALMYELPFYINFSIGIVTRRVVPVPVAIIALLIAAGAVTRPQARR